MILVLRFGTVEPDMGSLCASPVENTELIETASDHGNGGWVIWWVALGTALMLRAARGYRPFPSVDDFTYVPLARAAMDRTLYSSDTIIQATVSHVPLWNYLVQFLDMTCGLPMGLWLFTITLSIATVLALVRWTQALGGNGLLFPLAVIIAFSAKLPGLGRGEFDGIFGNAFHMQWLALCVLLWTFDAVIRRRSLLTGVLLGVAAICHPIVAGHGAFAISCAILFSGPGRWRRLILVGIVSFVISSPTVVPLLVGLIKGNNQFEEAKAIDVAELGFLFRAGHENIVKTSQLSLFFVSAFAGLAGIASLYETKSSESTRLFFGLQFGQLLLLLSVAYFHTDLFPDDWMSYSALPFQLHLTRTTPLILALSMVALITAIEREFLQGKHHTDGSQRLRIGWLSFWALCGSTLLFFLLACVEWTFVLVCIMALCLVTIAVASNHNSRRIVIAMWCAAGGLSFIWFVYASQLEATVSPRDRQLYQWIESSTPIDALFIIPPGQIDFRYYTKRSVYVDFKTFVAIRNQIPRWRRRLEEVASPDKIAMKSRGWPGIAEWDRTYANRNNPTRIAELLEATQADFLLWNAEGLEIPPYVLHVVNDDFRVEVVYQRDGYKIFQLRKGRREQPRDEQRPPSK